MMKLSYQVLCKALIIAFLVPTGGSARAQTAPSVDRKAENAQANPPASRTVRAPGPRLPSNRNTATRAWVVGVPLQRQEHAEALYQEGNRQFNNGFFALAVAKYRAALRHWNHPGIHYNLALALVILDRPIEAYESIVAALAHGAAGLHPDEYQRAIEYRRMLQGRIAAVEVACDEPGAVVTLDGQPLFTGPGQVTTIVLPGKHQVVASKPGYLVTTKTFKAMSPRRTRVELRMLTANRFSPRVQRWPAWTAIGLGVGTGAAAAMLHWQVRVDIAALNNAWRESCPMGCTMYPESLDVLRERLESQRKIAYAGYATAGALLTLGAVLAYFDRSQTMESGARRETVQLSGGGPAGSAGIAVHIPF
jgi:tetratricopeptide (TPR) repeat protein